jgi:hypothetical protein
MPEGTVVKDAGAFPYQKDSSWKNPAAHCRLHLALDLLETHVCSFQRSAISNQH